ncbi:2-amino-4-hydroxy-6-hydroxymethyldihydropteridine diphosphokinase [Legionella sp. W05-934-2]|jgi:2-amino-4-hydroxy-6-hydroxymethyldihydropteridine diphosphokinase|uniref:2-amino-4-hydroxy-6- hydroxymethyldihydropteridine diphosphokinase n=1 Tax=Legionella sp. W05-934-2 TaxID=1198649 RepID=UPI0034632BB3
MIDCYIALGSNLATPNRQIRTAIKHLKNLPHSHVIQVAPFYCNPAIGLKNQPKFINTVVHIKTRIMPLNLLALCQKIEKYQGRVRKRRWGARKIDVDLIIYGEKSMHHPKLTLPHPRYRERDFVRIPLSYLDWTLI